MPFRPENASAFKITSHTVNLNGESVRIHELNNFPAVFLRKYFSYVNRERRVYAINLKQDVGPWLGVMDQLAKKAPDLYGALVRYDRAMIEINRADFIYRDLSLKTDTPEAKEAIRKEWQEGMRALNDELWPTDEDVALRDVQWSMAYDTICEIAKIIAPELNRQEITERADLA